MTTNEKEQLLKFHLIGLIVTITDREMLLGISNAITEYLKEVFKAIPIEERLITRAEAAKAKKASDKKVSVKKATAKKTGKNK